MYDNILHKPLALRPGASSTAWSLLQGLLEKDGQHRLGSRDDFVSAYFSMHLSKYKPDMQKNFFFLGSPWWLICMHHNTAANDLQMYLMKLTFEKYKIMFFILYFQNEIRAHSFFSSINWDDLVQKKIPPPFTPRVVSICFFHSKQKNQKTLDKKYSSKQSTFMCLGGRKTPHSQLHEQRSNQTE